MNISQSINGFILYFEYGENPVPMLSPHHHVELELNLVVDGSAQYHIGGKKYLMAPGTVIWLPPMLEHQLVGKTSNFKNVVIVFSKSFLPNRKGSDAFEVLFERTNAIPFLTRIDRMRHQVLVECARQVSLVEDRALRGIEMHRYAGNAFGTTQNVEYQHNKPELLNAALEFIFQMAWDAYVESIGDVSIKQLHPSIRKACDLLIKDDLETPLPKIAQKSGLSESRLSRLFKEQMGVSLTDYRNNLKLDKFLKLYAKNGKGHSNITELAYEAGFGSYAQFFKVFRRITGISPSEFKKND